MTVGVWVGYRTGTALGAPWADGAAKRCPTDPPAVSWDEGNE